MTAPVVPTTIPAPGPAPDIPPWISHLLTVALPLVGLLFAKLGLKDSATAAQALVLAVGIVAGFAAHAVAVISRNGVTKAGLEKSFTEEELAFRSNLPALKAAYRDATTVVNSIPGGPAALATIGSQLAALQAQVNTIPETQRAAAADVLRSWLSTPGAAVPTTTTGAPTVTIQSAAGVGQVG